MSQGSNAAKELEAELRWRLQKAQALYRESVQQEARMLDELNQGLVPRADGSFAVAQARRAAALARNEVRRILDTYVNLAVRGKMPPPDEDDERLLI